MERGYSSVEAHVGEQGNVLNNLNGGSLRVSSSIWYNNWTRLGPLYLQHSEEQTCHPLEAVINQVRLKMGHALDSLK